MASVVGWALAVPFICALASAGSYWADQRLLYQVAADVTLNVPPTTAARTLALTLFLARDTRCRKNFEWALFAPWRGPTSVDILTHGGDCADKSQLLVALLRTLDIRATPAMLFGPRGPSHTVVEVQLSKTQSMVVDPLWGLYFPKPTPALDTLTLSDDEMAGAAGYYNLLEMRQNPALLWPALKVAQAHAPLEAKIQRYNVHSDIYDKASTVNWSHDPVTARVGQWLERLVGERRYAFYRPAILEEPKAFAAVMWLLFGVLLCLLRSWSLHHSA